MDQPPIIDPADVKVGDVVEYETVSEVEPLLIRALVENIKFNGGSLFIAGGWRNASPTYATVRLVRRRERGWLDG